jgi:hypothetical protein
VGDFLYALIRAEPQPPLETPWGALERNHALFKQFDAPSPGSSDVRSDQQTTWDDNARSIGKTKSWIQYNNKKRFHLCLEETRHE